MEDIETLRQILQGNGIKLAYEIDDNDLVTVYHLVQLLLDSLERKIFEGKTLQELLANTIE